jgi:hypothetical protein
LQNLKRIVRYDKSLENAISYLSGGQGTPQEYEDLKKKVLFFSLIIKFFILSELNQQEKSRTKRNFLLNSLR